MKPALRLDNGERDFCDCSVLAPDQALGIEDKACAFRPPTIETTVISNKVYEKIFDFSIR